MKSNRFTEHTYELTNVNPYPQKFSQGVYIQELASRMMKDNISSTALRLFIYICSDLNDYNQTCRSRREFANVLGIKYNAARMSKLVKELVENEWVTIFEGDIITVNPFIVLPLVSNPKMKAGVQEAWRDIVEFA